MWCARTMEYTQEIESTPGKGYGMTMTRYGDAVNDALDRLDDLGFEWGENLTVVNHGPMGAETMAILGFPEQVAGWADAYHRHPHHERPAPRFALDAADETSWRPALGAFSRAGDWEQLFRRELAEAPWREVLARWWPRLLPGLLAGLTHGAIRTAHAVRSLSVAETTGGPTSQQVEELARGLAYWAARFQGLPGSATLNGTMTVAEAVARLPRPPGPATFDGRIGGLGEFPGYDEALGALAPAAVQPLLSTMTSTFAGIYLAHPEVFPVPLIHAVTAPAAVRIVLPHLPVELHEPSVAALWQVHTALMLIFTSSLGGEGEALARAADVEPPSWPELAARAVENGDEHVMKFTEACWREYGLRPDPRFPAAVLAAHERIASPIGGL
jgi:hypothetical protein